MQKTPGVWGSKFARSSLGIVCKTYYGTVMSNDRVVGRVEECCREYASKASKILYLTRRQNRYRRQGYLVGSLQHNTLPLDHN